MKEKRNDTPISAKKDIMGDKTVRVRADLHHVRKYWLNISTLFYLNTFSYLIFVY